MTTTASSAGTPAADPPSPWSAEAANRGPAPSPGPGPGDRFNLRTLVGRDVPILVVLGALILLTRFASSPLSNSDTFFHLRFGHEFLVGNWSLSRPGSVTSFGTADWTPTQWLPQVVLAQLEAWFGLPGVAWLAGALFLSLGASLYLVARQWAGPLVSASLMVVALFAASAGLSMRPQVISYLLVLVTTAAWLKTREDRRIRWWLVPLTWLWAMCHGMWPIGIVIGVVALVGIAVDRAVPRRQWLKLASVPVLSAAVAALTPVGPSLYSAVLLVNSRGKYFAEWGPPRFTEPECLAFLVLTAALVIRLLRRTRPSTWTEILLLMLAGGWGLYSGRTIPVGAMILVPLAASALREVFGRQARAGSTERVVVLGGAALCLTVLAFVVPTTAQESPLEPSWAAELDALPAGTIVLDNWGAGGYLMWRYPRLDLVMNGYGDIFTDGELERNYRMDGTAPGWLDDVRSTGATLAVLQPGEKLAAALRDLEGWTVLHVDREADLELLEAPDGWARGP